MIENDLHARHSWLVAHCGDLGARLDGDPEYYDAKIAGWWVWGLCCWIGCGWCSGKGPWHPIDGRLMNTKGDAGQGVNRQRPHLSNAGQGVNRKREGLREWMEALSERLRGVRVCCGDWARVTGKSVTYGQGLTGVFLDPPYSTEAERDMMIYRKDCGKVAHDVKAWAIANGDNPLLRIALCGYEGEHDMPESWTCHAWKTAGGYGLQAEGGAGRNNSVRERIWFSPHCLTVDVNQMELALE